MADYDDEPFNSSDIDIQQEERPHSRAESIRKLIENSVEDRRTSKIFEKTLVFGKGVAGTQYAQNLWRNRFDAARVNTFHQNIEDTPDGETIRRFLSTIALRTSARDSAKPAPSESWLADGFRHIVDYCRFQFKDFKLSSQDSTKTATYLDRLVPEGKLVRGRWRKRHWVGYTLVLRMLQRWYTYAIEKGTINMDITLARGLSISLMATAGNRVGDLSPGRMGAPLECLRYEHIQMSITDGEYTDGEYTNEDYGSRASLPEVDYARHFRNIVAKFTLVYTKGLKEDPSTNFVFELRPLDNPNDNAACPVVGTLSLALRLGLVYGKTIREVIDHTLKRNDRTIQWRRPKLPVIPAVKVPSLRELDIEKPACSGFFSKALERAADLAGLTVKVTTHSLRRGHAKDVSALTKKGFKGTATLEVAASMGHSHQAFTNGVTKDYVGHIEEHIWNLKAQQKYTSPFAIKVTENVLQPDRKHTPVSEITAHAANIGLDYNDPKARAKASYSLKRKKVEDWRQAEIENAAPLKKSRPQEKPAKHIVLSQFSNNEINISQMALSRSREGDDTKMHEAAQASTTAPAEQTENQHFSIAFTEEKNIDPELLDQDKHGPSSSAAAGNHFAGTSVLQQFLCSVLDRESDSPKSIEDDQTTLQGFNGETCEDLALQSTTQSQLLKLPTLDFIDGLARFNVCCLEEYCNRPNNEAVRKKFTVSGGSREEPRPYMSNCTKTPGCHYTTSNKRHLDAHEVVCSIESVQRKQDIDEEGRPFACTLCAERFRVKRILDEHMKDHNFTPIPCEHGCRNGKLFTTRKSYNSHLRVFHEPGWLPIECPLKGSGCERKTVFANREGGTNHLVRVHKLNTKAAKALLPPKQTNRPQDGGDDENTDVENNE